MLEADGGQSSALIYTRAADLARRLQLDEALSLDRRGRAEEPTQFVIDGEAVILGVDGISDFNASILAISITRSSSTPLTSSR
jgi:ATP-dependent DNA ligase